jgi:hypothetical protein
MGMVLQRTKAQRGASVLGVAALFLLLGKAAVFGGWQLDIETGVAISGYNDVRIPGDSGTKLSLSKELSTDPSVFLRGRLTYVIGSRHSVSAFAAPLTLKAKGKVDQAVTFEDETFPPDTPLDATYRFDSYRLTYRYDIVQKETLSFGLGFTAKIRDAEISLESSSAEAVKTNTGFVPLINFRLDYRPLKRFGFLFEGDALAAPQGRAEDVLLGITYTPAEKFTFKLGYRILEGGADNEEVYTFALINFITIGSVISF